MSKNYFLEQDNLQMLWEVLIDEPLIKQTCNTEAKMNDLIRIFESNVRDFFMAEKNNCSDLIELNKKYILLIITYVMKISNTTSISNITNAQANSATNQYRKITIHPDEPVKQSITFEEIQNDRKSLFEKELNKKQEEFTNAMTLPVPPVPNFSDNLDQPISEIELEIKRIQEQRNYDIEIINNTNKNTNTGSDENWLKPQETSIKNEKLLKINSLTSLTNITTNNSPKHITWEDEIEQTSIQAETTNIFGKLKKITNDTIITNSDGDINSSNNFQLQIDEIKKDIFVLNKKLDLILQKI
uniref:Uncharacterized protein n=1 Tax=viral metagenome TaxID=1070528 RepID=A0A6C0D8R8_9ZZZZ